MTTAACTNYQGLYVQRIFLGALESGVSPGWMLVVGGCVLALPNAITGIFANSYKLV